MTVNFSKNCRANINLNFSPYSRASKIFFYFSSEFRKTAPQNENKNFSTVSIGKYRSGRNSPRNKMTETYHADSTSMNTSQSNFFLPHHTQNSKGFDYIDLNLKLNNLQVTRNPNNNEGFLNSFSTKENTLDNNQHAGLKRNKRIASMDISLTENNKREKSRIKREILDLS